MTTKTTREQKLTKARALLLLDHPFFGTLATRLQSGFDAEVETAAVNGERIAWNPEWLDGLSLAETMGVLAHEVMHVANGHCWRRGGRDTTAWNEACDKAINPILKGAGLTLPACALDGPGNTAAERLYVVPIKQDGDDNQPGDGERSQDPGGCGAVEDAPGEAKQEQEAEWRVAVAQAAESAKSQGMLPADLVRLVESIVNPRVAWETLLRDFVERTARNDYNWSRPNRRYLQSGVVLPSLISEELPEIVLAVDTSGSIGQRELDAFAAEVSAVLGCYETTIHVVYADAQVAHTHVVTRADLPIKLEPKGGGGTDFRPVFEWVELEMLSPACLIYLTDGYGTFPSVEPDYPVLWIMTTDKKAPVGETVRMEVV